jgi:hypothetical protein
MDEMSFLQDEPADWVCEFLVAPFYFLNFFRFQTKNTPIK